MEFSNLEWNKNQAHEELLSSPLNKMDNQIHLRFSRDYTNSLLRTAAAL